MSLRIQAYTFQVLLLHLRATNIVFPCLFQTNKPSSHIVRRFDLRLSFYLDLQMAPDFEFYSPLFRQVKEKDFVLSLDSRVKVALKKYRRQNCCFAKTCSYY
jgi:hypothetical protein